MRIWWQLGADNSAILPTAAILLLLSCSEISHSYEFTPTEAEWSTWPEYCRARYAVTTWVKRTPYNNRVPGPTITRWRDTVGPDTFYSLHHYCAGIAQLNRAMTIADAEDRRRMLEAAEAEMVFSYGNVPTDSILFGEVATNLGRVHAESGRLDVAQQYYQEAVKYQPDYAGAYIALASMYRKSGKNPSEVLAILEQGIAKLEVPSAEIHYFAGLVSIEAKDLPAARRHAVIAYRLGYPLPGLQKKLMQLDAWNVEGEPADTATRND